MPRHHGRAGTQRHDEGRGSGVSRSEHVEHEACMGIIIRLAERGPVLSNPDRLPRFLDVVRATYPAAHRRQLEGILNSKGRLRHGERASLCLRGGSAER